jgi:hypothetical protein
VSLRNNWEIIMGGSSGHNPLQKKELIDQN